tara:strand:- start:936 stop:1799 length:864 start_codon:yes stop_codon:yes gene_type:complete
MFRNSTYSNKKKELEKGLYLVPTPIGNLKDITFRAIDILQKSDFILCEDTRVSKILLQNYNIKSNLISNHKFNEKKNLSKIIDLLKKGNIISIITDAGTPAISDPGRLLVSECINNKLKIIPLPGASAVTMAVSISGFSDKFFFYGFFPEKIKTFKNDLKDLSSLNSSIVFFVSAKKMTKISSILIENFSGRKILICREMTKYFEEFIRTDIDRLKDINLELKGELTIVISEKKQNKKSSQKLSESDKIIIKNMIKKISIKEIINLINRDKKYSKKEIYNYCVCLKK